MGHIRLSDIPQPTDYGRYQAEFGFDGAVLNGTNLNSNGDVELSSQTVVTQNQSDTYQEVWGSTGKGQRLDGTFTSTMDTINYIDINIGYIGGTPTAPVIVTIFDETTSQVLGSLSKTGLGIGYNRFAFATPIAVTRGHIIQIRIDADGLGDTSNKYYVNLYSCDDTKQTNASFVYTSNLWSSFSIQAADLRYVLNYSTKTTSGTVTKTITPRSPEKWGNYKVMAANIEVNNSATITVKSIADGILKGPITLVNGENLIDLSDLSTTTYPSLKIVGEEARTTIVIASPTISASSPQHGRVRDYKSQAVHGRTLLLLSEPMHVFCKNFFLKVASNFSIVLQLHFPQCCKFYFPVINRKIEGLQTFVT